MKDSEIRARLIEQGVKNLKEFGYPNCTSSNILTDGIYKEFFLSMLKDNKGHNSQIDKVIDQLIADIEK
jgi:hypothetical protein